VKEKPLNPKEVYQIINGRYFRGRLPDVPVRFNAKSFIGPRKRILGSTYVNRETGRPVKIDLNPRYKDASRVWIQTLIHEAVHVQQWRLPEKQAHGRKFNARMKQLAALGAFNGLW